MKVSRKQLRKIIAENIYDTLRDTGSSAYDFMFGSNSSGYTSGQVVTTSDEDPYEYKEVDNRWVFRTKGSQEEWKNVNAAGIDVLNRQFKQAQSAPESSGYTSGQVVTTSSSDPYEYKKQGESWVFRKKDSSESWRPLNAAGAEVLNRKFGETTSSITSAAEEEITSADSVYEALVRKGILEEGDTLLLVDGTRQRFYLKKSSSSSEMSGLVSTGRKGLGNENNSGKTSTGLMQVMKIHGTGLESGTVLVGREPTVPPIVLGPRQPSPRTNHTAEVVTRAITLTGLETANRNVKSRNIYLHGTNREQHLGRPASGGCIRMKSSDVIKLADTELNPGDHVYVYSGPATIDSSLLNTSLSALDRGLSMMFEESNLEIDNDVQPVEDNVISDEEARSVLDRYPPELGA